MTKKQLSVWSYSAWLPRRETLQYLWQPHAPINPFITLRITWDTSRTSGQASPHMFCLLIRHASCEGEQCTIPQHNESNGVQKVQLVILSVFPVRKMDTYNWVGGGNHWHVAEPVLLHLVIVCSYILYYYV